VPWQRPVTETCALAVLLLCSTCSRASYPGAPRPTAPPSCFTERRQPFPQPWITSRAVRIPVGYIVLVRQTLSNSPLGAFRPEEQETQGRGQYKQPFVRYTWWYELEKSGGFRSSSTRTGYGESEELYPTPGPVITVGQYLIPWSAGGQGAAWYYYNLPWASSATVFEFGLTCAVDARQIDYDAVVWVRAPQATPRNQ
jgi:hypothetical protein